jgi:hypothetical protein
MTTIVPGNGEILVSVEYDETGLSWARLYDNRLLAWHVSLPTAAPNTSPVASHVKKSWRLPRHRSGTSTARSPSQVAHCGQGTSLSVSFTQRSDDCVAG